MRGMSGSRPADGRQQVQREPDGGIADGVDLGRDAAGRGALDEVRQAGRIGHPQATALIRCQRPIELGLRCPRGGARSATPSSRPRSTSASRRGPVPPDRTRARRHCGARRPGRSRASRRAGRRGRGPAAGPCRRGGRRPGTSRRGPDPGPARPDRARPPRRARPAPGPTAIRALARSASDASGMWTVTRRAAASNSTPDGAPSARRVGRCRPVPPRSRRSRPPSGTPRGWPTGRGGRGPTGRSDGRVPRPRGRRPSASHPSGPSPSRGPGARRRGPRRGPRDGPRRSGAGRPPASALVVRSSWRVARAAAARCRWASVRPGIATSSGSRSRRSVCGSARVSRSIADPAKATRPSRIPMASTQPKPASPPSVAIRPVISASRGTRRQSRSVGSDGPVCSIGDDSPSAGRPGSGSAPGTAVRVVGGV